MARLLILLVGLALAACGAEPPRTPRPRHYVAERASSPLALDGKLDDAAWQEAPWSRPFLDIRGASLPRPRFATRMKMLWDDGHLYVAAEMEEPHLQASFTARDSYIYQEDNDFEVFLDPDGDARDYFELEVNALGTEWDLLLDKPYGIGGEADHAFDLQGVVTRVHLDGTLNQPLDTDRGWSVEIAIPFAALGERAGVPLPPRPGDAWRINFSRVQWRFDAKDGGYVKTVRPDGSGHYPEDNWVWSPQGEINMHLPGRWGTVEFVGVPARANGN